VSSPTVVVADGGDGQTVLTQQGVDQRRLAGAGRAQKGGRDRVDEEAAQRVEGLRAANRARLEAIEAASARGRERARSVDYRSA
jgi:hypothetical protein